jgi:cobalamin biosynthetic protein CobC
VSDVAPNGAVELASWDRFARHGGWIDEAARAFPAAPQPWLDLSTGINPVAWAPAEPLVVDPGPLPAPSALAALERAAAAQFGVDASRVAAVPGSEIALRLLPTIGLPAPITAVRASYGTHIDVAHRLIGAERPAEEVGAGTLLLASVIEPEVLHRIAAAQARMGGWLVVDEAFADAVPAQSILPELDPTAPVVVMRSFGKFFGLAGVRLGFCVAPPAIIGRLRELIGAWPVSAHAVVWGRAAYENTAWIEATRGLLVEQARALDEVLARHGLAAGGACPLFRLVTHPDARAIFGRLACAGILTRPFHGRADWLRVGLPPGPGGLARLDQALASG